MDHPLQDARILVAEDNVVLALDLIDRLREAGAEVLGPAVTLAQTLALAKLPSIACAVLDVNLGRETVFPAAQVLRERGISTIFHTAIGNQDRLSQDWPDAQVLAKPASLEFLMRAILVACCGIASCVIPAPDTRRGR